MKESMADGVIDEFGPVIEIQFLVNMKAMALDRIDRKGQVTGNFGVCKPPGDELNNFLLSLSEQIVYLGLGGALNKFLNQTTRQFWVKYTPPWKTSRIALTKFSLGTPFRT